MPIGNTVRLFSSFSRANLSRTLVFSKFSHVRLLSSATVTTQGRVSFDKTGSALLTVATPNGELRRFVIPNDSQTTLAVLAENLKQEGITSGEVEFKSAEDGVQLAKQATSAWYALASQPVQLVLGDKLVGVEVDGEPETASTNQSESLMAVENDLVRKSEELRNQLKPLDGNVTDILQTSHRRTRALAWAGLAYMSLQFGFLARLTWWEYSWDIVEPISYFVTYGTGLFFYAYYVVTQQDSNFVDMFNRQKLITAHKRINKNKFDLIKYNQLRDDLQDVESQLAILRKSTDWLVANKTKSAAS